MSLCLCLTLFVSCSIVCIAVLQATRTAEGGLSHIPSIELVIVNSIAEGAFGKVYKAMWTSKGIPVILKSSKLTSPDPASLQKGQSLVHHMKTRVFNGHLTFVSSSELETVAKIEPDPCLVHTYGVCTDFHDSEGPRMVLELCEFGSLRSYLSTIDKV